MNMTNKHIRKQWRKLKKEEEHKVLKKIKSIENNKNDSRRMHRGVKELKSREKKKPTLKGKTGIVANEKDQIEVITKYFTEIIFVTK